MPCANAGDAGNSGNPIKPSARYSIWLAMPRRAPSAAAPTSTTIGWNVNGTGVNGSRIAICGATGGEPYQADVGPGDHLEGEVWFRSSLQLGVTVDGWGDGLLIVSHMPGTPEPFAAASMLLTTYGLDAAAFPDIEGRWDEWWNKRYEIPEPEPEDAL